MILKHVGWAAMAIALAACSGKDKSQLGDDRSLLGDLPVVAHQVEVDGQKMPTSAKRWKHSWKPLTKTIITIFSSVS